MKTKLILKLLEGMIKEVSNIDGPHDIKHALDVTLLKTTDDEKKNYTKAKAFIINYIESNREGLAVGSKIEPLVDPSLDSWHIKVPEDLKSPVEVEQYKRDAKIQALVGLHETLATKLVVARLIKIFKGYIAKEKSTEEDINGVPEYICPNLNELLRNKYKDFDFATTKIEIMRYITEVGLKLDSNYKDPNHYPNFFKIPVPTDIKLTPKQLKLHNLIFRLKVLENYQDN